MTGGGVQHPTLRRVLSTGRCKPIRVGAAGGVDAAPFEAEGQRRRALERIDAALRRLESGAFGYCQQCGARIAPGRLEFDPATPLCRDCAHESDV